MDVQVTDFCIMAIRIFLKIIIILTKTAISNKSRMGYHKIRMVYGKAAQLVGTQRLKVHETSDLDVTIYSSFKLSVRVSRIVSKAR